MAKKPIKSRRKTSGPFIRNLKKQREIKGLSHKEQIEILELKTMKRGLEEKIPDPVKRLEYIKAMAEHCIITCDICEDKKRCEKNGKEYKYCKFNPINGG